MSGTLKSVFQEYTRLRLNGLEASEAVRALHPYVKDFDDATRNSLAQNMRAWENQRTEKISLLDRGKLAKAAEARDADETIACPNCGRDNVVRETICYACGALLEPNKANSTDVLPAGTDNLMNDARFTEDDLLVLNPVDGGEPLVVTPQTGLGQLSIGRGNHQNDIDVDLEPYNAGTKGVSRMHAALIYYDLSESVALSDLGSTNGTFINEQRLHSNERRTLRHNDSVRFGSLAFRVEYQSG